MGSLTNYAEAIWLDHVFNGAYTPVAALYVGLATADPTDAATGAAANEVADANGYERAAISFGAAAARAITQSAQVNFPTATGTYSATHWFVADSGSHGAGNVLAHGALVAQQTAISGRAPYIPSGEISISINAGGWGTSVVNSMLDLIFRNQAYAQPSKYVVLLEAVAGDSDTGSTISEPVSAGYDRVLVSAWDDAVPGDPTLVDNTSIIDFGTADATWDLTGFGIVDAAADGNLICYNNDMADESVISGDPVYFPAGALDITAA